MSKEGVRKVIKAARRAISDSYRSKAEGSIADKVIDIVGSGKNVLAYYSYNGEVGTDKLIRRLREIGCKIYLPAVDGEDMLVKSYNESVAVDGLYEPSGEAVDKDILDVVIVPLVAYDRTKNRLGYGKGYYDRFLKGIKARSIGIAFKVQEVESVFATSYDVPLDIIVNELEVL